MPTDNDKKQSAPSASSAITMPREVAPSVDPSASTLMGSAGASSKTTIVAHPEGLVGTRLDGRYFIEKELGHGGIGAVYLARDRKLHDKLVVVKVLLEKSLQDPWVVQKFQQEKEALARIDHPGVVGILDTGELPDGKPYIVMQYIDGVSLRDAIKAKSEGMDLERAASILKQVGAALSAVHEKKTYHRDLKPENIMLQQLGRFHEQVKIVDFGIAKVKESLVGPSTITGAVTAGTIVYMSPEQLRGEKVTAASDIYSLGMIAYEMITGRRPFNAETIAHLAEMQLEGVRVKPGDLRPRLPKEAERVILRALSFNPAARPQNAGEFGDELARALMDEDETLKQRPRAEVELPSTQFSIDPVPLGPEPIKHLEKTLATPFEMAIAETFGQSPIPSSVKHESHKRRWPALAGVCVLAVTLIFGGYWIIAKRESFFGAKINANNPETPRSLVYSLTVQKMRDGKSYEEPFRSSGQEIFENGYKFRLNVSSPQFGYLYVFNEGAAEGGGLSLNIIYPTPDTNQGWAKLDANQMVQTNWNTFLGEAGTEEFWIVWSASPVTELEAARDTAFKSKGELTDAGMIRVVREFLTKHSDPKPETTKDAMKQQTRVSARGDLLVKLVELEHR